MPTASFKPKLNCRRLQFSLSSLGVLIAIICVGLAWLANARHEVRKRVATIEAIEKLGGHVDFDPHSPFRPKWLRPLLGDDTPGEVVRVSFNGTRVTDEGLAQLAGFARLEDLSLYNTQISDAGLVHIAGLSNLKWLWLDDTQVTDAGMAHLAGLVKLEFLLVSNTAITDIGLAHLAGLTNLKSLSLDNTDVTDSGIARLQRLVPNVLISRE